MGKPMKKEAKAQSAMEYLMTYGWALLAIAVVLAILYATGILGGGISRIVGGNNCIEATGYLCSNPAYTAYSGNAAVTVGQESSQTYYNVAFALTSPSTGSTGVTSYGVPNTIFTNLATLNASVGVNNQLTPGTTALLTDIPVSAANTAAGTSVTGEMWMAYTTSSGGTCANLPPASNPLCSYAQIGKISMVAK